MSLMDYVKDVVDTQLAGLGPMDDILPILVYRNREGEGNIIGIATDLDDRQEKDKLALFMLCNLAVDNACEAVFVSAAWGVTQPRDSWPDDAPMPSDHPDRQELIFAFHVTPDGQSCQQALLTRHPDTAPTRSEWEELDGFAGAGGRFADAINNGLRMAATMPDEARQAIDTAVRAGHRDAAIRGMVSAIKSASEENTDETI